MVDETTKLPLATGGLEEETMPVVKCAQCGNDRLLRLYGLNRGALNFPLPTIELRGILTCHGHPEPHEWPITLVSNANEEGFIRATTNELGAEAKNLKPSVPEGIKEDIQEAERTHYSLCYKSSVVMCRRALQLALEEKGALGRTLGQCMTHVRASQPNILSVRAWALLEGIKDYGDGGAHRKEDIEESAARQVIYTAVLVLNELFP